MTKTLFVAASMLMLSGSVLAASAPVKDLAKRAVDRTANWIIDHYDAKERVYGKGDAAKDPAAVAIVITALCEQRRDYKEANGPYISDPVKLLTEKVKDDGSVDGAKDAGFAARVVAEALESTKNEKYKDMAAKLRAKAAAPPAFTFTKQAELASIELKPENLVAVIGQVRALAKAGTKDLTVDGQSVKWAEAITEGLLKKEQKNGSYTGDVHTDALVLQLLNVCYKML
jgi:hypothetical protein